MSPIPSTPPRSIKELNRRAKVYTDDCIPIDIYLSSANLLLKQARIYYKEENEEQAYVYYLKYINLVLNELDKRAGFDQLKNKDMIQTCIEALDAIELLRPSLEAVYESYELFHKTDDNHHAVQQRTELLPKEETSSEKIEVIENEQSAPPTNPFLDDAHPAPNDNYNQSIQEPMDWEYTQANNNNTFNNHQQYYQNQRQSPQLYPYSNTQNLYRKQEQQVPPPPIPPKIKIEKEKPPPLPPKIQLFLNQKDVHEESDTLLDDTLLFGSSTNKLRVLNVPKGLQETFLKLARFNTSNNVETCGILGGKLKNNELYVTSLLIPNQEGTSDTCTTKDEEAIFEHQDKNGLITLGWIHTHPSQTCFLSSVDLHTQCSYQLMLPEAIAIVCAPNHTPDFGIFRLTSPDGLREITNCRNQDSFHPHSEQSVLYEDRSGHVLLTELGTLEIVDLR